MSENASSRSSDINDAFFEIWQLWPGQGRVRSKSKTKCIEALSRACGKLQPAQITTAVRKFVQSTDPKFVPGLDRWLRDEKFEHFIEAKIQNANSSIDWQAVLRRWFETGSWPRNVGPTPDARDYAGPIEPVEALLPEYSAGHPTAIAMRRMIDHRRRA